MTHRGPMRERSVGNHKPDVKISQHLQIDNGLWDALDAVVVEIEQLEGGKQTHLWGDFRETILGQICNTDEQQLMKYVHSEHSSHILRFRYEAAYWKTNQYLSAMGSLPLH